MSPPTELLERYAEAFTADPVNAAAQFYTGTIVMRVPGTHAGAGTAVGAAAVLSAHEALHRLTGGTARPGEVLIVLQSGDLILVRVRFAAHRCADTLDWDAPSSTASSATRSPRSPCSMMIWRSSTRFLSSDRHG